MVADALQGEHSLIDSAPRIRRHVFNVNSKELVEAWKDKDQRILSDVDCMCMLACMCLKPGFGWFSLACLYLLSDSGFGGQKLKETLLKTGSLDEVDACASQLRSHAVKEKNVEKPVTKKMLAEVYHWDEFLGCKHRSCMIGMRGRHAWQACMAGMHGRHTWQACMAGMHGRHTWQACMAGMHGRHSWQAYMEGMHGRHAWQACMAGIHGR